MEGTLLIGDHLLVNKFIFGGNRGLVRKSAALSQLQRGDIIVSNIPMPITSIS